MVTTVIVMRTTEAGVTTGGTGTTTITITITTTGAGGTAGIAAGAGTDDIGQVTAL
jgi:hypothetical protein